MFNFGKGPRLIDANPWLCDKAKRIEHIIEVAEINSVMEGLPSFTDELKERLRIELRAADKSPASEDASDTSSQ